MNTFDEIFGINGIPSITVDEYFEKLPHDEWLVERGIYGMKHFRPSVLFTDDEYMYDMLETMRYFWCPVLVIEKVDDKFKIYGPGRYTFSSIYQHTTPMSDIIYDICSFVRGKYRDMWIDVYKEIELYGHAEIDENYSFEEYIRKYAQKYGVKCEEYDGTTYYLYPLKKYKSMIKTLAHLSDFKGWD